MTAHASQGLTLDAAIVDLAVGAEMSPVASYVALSRVRSPDNLLIFRPFPVEVFAAGASTGPSTLIAWLQGRLTDYPSGPVRPPRRKCNACSRLRSGNPEEVNDPQGFVCITCRKTKCRCVVCGIWHRSKTEAKPCVKCRKLHVRCWGCAQWVARKRTRYLRVGAAQKVFCPSCSALRPQGEPNARRCRLGRFSRRMAALRIGTDTKLRCAGCRRLRRRSAFDRDQRRRKATVRKCWRCVSKKQRRPGIVGSVRGANTQCDKKQRLNASRQCVPDPQESGRGGDAEGSSHDNRPATEEACCRRCETTLPKQAFNAREWRKPATRRTCRTCAYCPRVKGMRTCKKCGLLQPLVAYATVKGVICVRCREETSPELDQSLRSTCAARKPPIASAACFEACSHYPRSRSSR